MTLRERIIHREPGRSACPCHDSKSKLSVSVKISDDGLIHDFGGCQTEDIIQALDLQWGDLFADAPRRSRWGTETKAARNASARRRLEEWRIRTLRSAAVWLRELDALADNCVQVLQVEPGNEKALDSLSWAYHWKSLIGSDFDRLNSKDTADHLAVWREHKGARNAA